MINPRFDSMIGLKPANMVKRADELLLGDITVLPGRFAPYVMVMSHTKQVNGKIEFLSLMVNADADPDEVPPEAWRKLKKEVADVDDTFPIY